MYPDPDKPFQGIVKALQDDPEAWQKACMAPCPPEVLPQLSGPSVPRAEQDPSPLAPVGLRAPSPTSTHRQELSPLPSHRSIGRKSSVQSISGTETATPVQELSAMSLIDQVHSLKYSGVYFPGQHCRPVQCQEPIRASSAVFSLPLLSSLNPLCA